MQSRKDLLHPTALPKPGEGFSCLVPGHWDSMTPANNTPSASRAAWCSVSWEIGQHLILAERSQQLFLLQGRGIFPKLTSSVGWSVLLPSAVHSLVWIGWVLWRLVTLTQISQFYLVTMEAPTKAPLLASLLQEEFVTFLWIRNVLCVSKDATFTLFLWKRLLLEKSDT